MGDNPGHLTREPQRVLMTTDAVGGVWQYSVDLTEGFSEHGVEVILATLGPLPSLEQKQHATRIPGLTLFESDFYLEWMPDAWRDVDASGHWLLQLASETRPDVIHLNGYSHAAFDWKQPVLVTAHSCVYSWWRAVHHARPGSEWSEYERRVRNGLARADAVVAPSAWMAAELQGDYDVDRRKIQVIHNFSRTDFRDTHKQPTILAAGRVWDEAKNIHMLEAIAPRLNWELRIAGSTTTTGARLPHSELMDEMNRAAIFAHPALYEPFGLTILEAAHAQCCLVLSDIPSLRELWDGAAIFLDPREPNAWLNELNALADDPDRRHLVADAAYEHASKYDTGNSVSKYLRIYTSLLETKSQRGKDVAA